MCGSACLIRQLAAIYNSMRSSFYAIEKMSLGLQLLNLAVQQLIAQRAFVLVLAVDGCFHIDEDAAQELELLLDRNEFAQVCEGCPLESQVCGLIFKQGLNFVQ